MTAAQEYYITLSFLTWDGMTAAERRKFIRKYPVEAAIIRGLADTFRSN